jgi:hypothetical protein
MVVLKGVGVKLNEPKLSLKGGLQGGQNKRMCGVDQLRSPSKVAPGLTA